MLHLFLVCYEWTEIIHVNQNVSNQIIDNTKIYFTTKCIPRLSHIEYANIHV